MSSRVQVQMMKRWADAAKMSMLEMISFFRVVVLIILREAERACEDGKSNHFPRI